MPHPKRIRQQLDAELALQLRKGRPARAAAVLAEIVDKDRDDDRLFVRLAELRLKVGDAAGARAAYLGAAEAAERKGFYLRAMAALRQMARTLAPSERPWLELSRLAMRLGLVADAVGFLDEGVRAWEATGERARVVEALRRSHELAPDEVRRALKLAQELRAAGARGEAVALLRADAARHRRAGREEAWLSLGRDLALLAPSVQLNVELARALLARGEPRGALKLLRPCLEGGERPAEAVALASQALAELARPVRPPAPAAPPVLSATPAPGAVRAVAPPPAIPLTGPFEPVVPDRPGRTGAAGPAEDDEALHVDIEVTGSAPLPAPTAGPLQELAGSAVRPAPAQAVPAAERGEGDAAGPVGLPSAGLEVEEEGEPEHEVVDLAAAALSVEDEPFIPPEEVGDELAHVAFLVAHGFEDEARERLDVVDAHHPGHPGVEALRRRLAAGRERRAARAPPGTPAPDLALDQLEGVAFASAEAVLESFRQGVAASVPAEDWATHHDLGIAYREMGLWSDALAEFETALLSAPGQRAVDCLLGVAQCHAGRGHHAEAARALERALGVVPLTSEAAAAVTYELGLVRRARGNGAAAARAFEAAERAVPGFRDARAQAARLRAEDGGGGPGPGLLPGAAGA